MKKTNLPGVQKLLETVAKLRSDEGCPWDKKQTHQSLIPYLLEEAWEVIDEIQKKEEGEELKKELGDLLLQVALHAQIAKEEERFDFDQVAESIAQKMIDRHPHVFGSGEKDLSDAELNHQWRRLKAEERKKGSVLDGIPQSQPELLTAFSIGKRAANLGFDWGGVEGVIDKVKEELDEVIEELDGPDPQRIEHEVGDLMFAVTSLARHFKINPEIALKKCNDRFRNRFYQVEKAIVEAEQQGRKLSLEEMEEYWQKAKKQLEGS